MGNTNDDERIGETMRRYKNNIRRIEDLEASIKKMAETLGNGNDSFSTALLNLTINAEKEDFYWDIDRSVGIKDFRTLYDNLENLFLALDEKKRIDDELRELGFADFVRENSPQETLFFDGWSGRTEPRKSRVIGVHQRRKVIIPR